MTGRPVGLFRSITSYTLGDIVSCDRTCPRVSVEDFHGKRLGQTNYGKRLHLVE